MASPAVSETSSLPLPAEEDDSPLRPATFKGQLDRFAYLSPPSTTSRTQSSSSNALSLSKTTSSKRTAEDDRTADSTPRKCLTRSISRSSTQSSALSNTTTFTSAAPAPTIPPTRSRFRRKRTTSSFTSTSTSKTNPSRYASVPNLLVDSIPPNLILLFIGLNPGLTTARTGHVYSHPSNLYWKLLASSGLTTRRHPPSDTYRLPELYGLGNTNIVSRPTKDGSELSKQEMDAGVPLLEEKIRDKRPDAVCIVGKSIWESIWRMKKERPIRKEEFRYGWQDEEMNMGRVEERRVGWRKEAEVGTPEEVGADGSWNGASVFVATTTSGLAAGMRPPEKEAIWKVLGDWVVKRRLERKWPRPPEQQEEGQVILRISQGSGSP